VEPKIVYILDQMNANMNWKQMRAVVVRKGVAREEDTCTIGLCDPRLLRQGIVQLTTVIARFVPRRGVNPQIEVTERK